MAGLRLFIGKASCTQLPQRPAAHQQRVPQHRRAGARRAPADHGRWRAPTAVLRDEFNCLSRWSDAAPEIAPSSTSSSTDDHVLERAFKAPSLRNVAERAPYMHAGQFGTLREVLDHYNRAPDAPAGHSELKPLQPDRAGAAAARGVSALVERNEIVTTIPTGIPGADELVGKGVYCGIPKNVPQPTRDRRAVVVGAAAECGAAARQLGAAGWKVTVITR